jgi:hypothetical protein
MAEEKKHKKDPEDWKIKRHRNGDEHINNCATGYRKKGFAQIHHIVSVTCMQDATIEKTVPKNQMAFIRNCLAETEWNINEEPNNVGMPKTIAYFLRPRDRWDDWPCHQVDHNPQYTDAVSGYLYKKIWSKLIRDRKKCVFDPEKLAGKLNTASTNYRTFLSTRGQGTRHCWNNRFELEKWYVPFSMDPGEPRARKPPPEVPTVLKNLFQLVG